MNNSTLSNTTRFFTNLGLTVIGAIFTTSVAFSQDIHFSQMYYSPLNLNPAMVGLDNPITAIVNYRTQWKAIAKPYSTIGASFDARLNEKGNMLRKKGIFAMGLNFYNDQAGDVKISTTSFSLNMGYHLRIGNNNSLGLGVYGGFANRFLDTQAGRWGSQFDGLHYNENLPSGETFLTDRFSFFDVGTGMVYRYRSNESYISKNDSKQFTVGFAAYHLSRPNYSFIDDGNDKLYMRFSAFATAIIGLNNSNYSILPEIYYQQQGPAKEILLGLYGRYRFQDLSSITGFNKGIYLALGVFYRNQDAITPKIMFDYNDFTLGLAYDVNISTLNTVSNARGGFEVFLKYGLTKGFAGMRSKI